jgi:AcrR family transcriptional regulator
MGTRAENREQKRARILAAARALFAEKGFEATTTREIAARARIASGTLFLYAETKADVVMLLFEDAIGAVLDAALSTLPAAAGLTAQLTHLYGAFIGLYATDPGLARIFVRELLWIEGPSRQRRQALEGRLFGAIAALVRAEIERGRLSADTDPGFFAMTSFSLYFTAIAAWLSGELDRAGAEAFLARALALRETGARP